MEIMRVVASESEYALYGDVFSKGRGIWCLHSNAALHNIIAEEVSPYFNGQKSVGDVVSIIQSRAEVYVSENS